MIFDCYAIVSNVNLILLASRVLYSDDDEIDGVVFKLTQTQCHKEVNLSNSLVEDHLISTCIYYSLDKLHLYS